MYDYKFVNYTEKGIYFGKKRNANPVGKKNSRNVWCLVVGFFNSAQTMLLKSHFLQIK